MTIKSRDTMGGLAKGLAVIETFRPEKPRQTIAEVSGASGLDRATARRCLLTLAQHGYADYDGKFFTLTPRVLRLGTACLATMPLPRLVEPVLDSLSDRLGESSSVSILDGHDIVYIARSAQKKVMSISLMPGSRLPAFCTSMGRVLLAALPEAEARNLVRGSQRAALTPHTITGEEALMTEIARARAQGYALIDQEIELGLRSIAVPLMNSRGRVLAAMNVGVATSRAEPDDMIRHFLPALEACQAEIRQLL